MRLKSKEDFFKLKENILKEKNRDNRIKILIGFGTCGIAAGARKIEEVIKKCIIDKNVKNAEIIRVGCVGYCYAEPTIEIVYPNNEGSVIIGNMTQENTPDIIDIHVINKSFESQYVIPRNFD